MGPGRQPGPIFIILDPNPFFSILVVLTLGFEPGHTRLGRPNFEVLPGPG